MVLTLCFASNNQHKLNEVRLALGPDFRILTLEEIGYHSELEETGATLQANAHQKASFIYTNFNVACFADDTGLEVTALNNEPGVYSARYAGPQRNNEENISLLLQKLEGKTNRAAQFRTVICLIDGQHILYFEGIVKGTILHERRGSMGFGYDSVFVPDGYSKTFAEMTMAEKGVLSHRGIAVTKLVEYLSN